VVFFGLGQGGGEDALRYTWADLITATVLWLAGRAGGGGAHLQPNGQPVLPAPGSTGPEQASGGAETIC